ncbi:MAG: phenylacetate--CoA ligase [Syntrophobacteraceae bacterium]|nr:phenylacetate--CoA ligase [Syntrophobacteraceae bacterium]
MVWNKEFECMSPEDLQRFQLKKLNETILWLYELVPPYRKKLEEASIRSEGIKRLEQLQELPFTVKGDLMENYPFGLCALPLKDVVRVHASSGTTGKPITGPYTARDMDHWTECMARVIWAAGVREDDIFQNAFGHGLFTGGMGFHQGATRIGCTVVPTSSGMTERQILLMKDFGADALGCTPSYALTIAERAEEIGMPIKDLKLRVGLFGAEPWTNAMRSEIEERMGIKATNNYGLTELGGPGTGFECIEARDGMHINEDHFIAEIIDPLTHKVLALGETGELVLTAVQRRAMPLLRFRTKDITSLTREKCACGRTLVKMGRIVGRTDDMLIINGVNVFPSQIESLLKDIPEVEMQYLLVVRKKKHLDELSLRVEARKEVYEAGREKIAWVERKIDNHIKGIMGIHVVVELAAPKALKRSEGKAVRVIDERPK